MTLREGDLLTPAQALRLLPIGRSTLHRLLQGGAIRGILVRSTGSRRGRWLVSRQSLERFVQEGLAAGERTSVGELVDADTVVAMGRGGLSGGKVHR